MSARPRVLVTRTAPADGGTEPNRYAPRVTVEVRVSWPPRSDPGAVDGLIAAACADAVREHQQRRAQP